MTAAIQTPTADCGHCRKPIRQNAAGIWGARARLDPHPWYCDGNPDDGKRHAAAGGYEVVWPSGEVYVNSHGETRLTEAEAKLTAPRIGGTWRRAAYTETPKGA